MALKIEDKNAIITRAVPSYYEVKKKEREDYALKVDNDLRELFLKTLEFYNKNYSKSFQDPVIVWEKPKGKVILNDKIGFVENLEGFTEEQLYLCREIMQYSIKERNYQSVSTFTKYNQLSGRIRNFIPGGKILDKIEREEEVIRKHMVEVDMLKKQLIEEKKAFEEKLKAKVKAKIPPKKINSFICEECGKKCTTKSALINHMKSHEK